jgi:transposase
MSIIRIGVDLAKRVFQIYGVDEREQSVVSKRLRRSVMLEFFAQLPPCLVAMEACGSSHHWARQLRRLGHEVQLIAPQFVRPYRRGDKNDSNDARAICEAAGRPDMHFVPIKDEEQQAVLTLHRARALLVGERTALGNQIRGLLAEYGIVIAQGPARLRSALPGILADAENGLPPLAREVFADLYERLQGLESQCAHYDRHIARLAQQMPAAQRLMQVPGVGPVTATALVATVGDARLFRNGRQFAAWLGLVPRQYSTGGKPRHGRITKRGDVYLRTLLVHGARALMCRLDRYDDPRSRWARKLKQRRGFNKATVALAAKQARILWSMLAHHSNYQPSASG